MKYIFSFQEAKDQPSSKFGGKGNSLVRLTSMGLPVPYGYVISADGFCDGKLTGESENELDTLISMLSCEDTYAVRSSALNEDGEDSSFAGAYETLTDVKVSDVKDAVIKVCASAQSARVQAYSKNMGEDDQGIAVVIQKFVKPLFAGVIFTSDVITGSSAVMKGNYVEGEGEQLVSGENTGKGFTINAIRYSYEGDPEFRRYARRLFKYASGIRNEWKMPMDIEWAVSEGKLYILQARPITTLKGFDRDTFFINGSLSEELLLTRTNVGEIFMCPISPLSKSVLDLTTDLFGVPFIDYVCGQPYMSISALCSVFVSLGFSKSFAYNKIRDIVGEIPEGVDIPVYPVSKRMLLGKLKAILASGKQSKKDPGFGENVSERVHEIAKEIIKEIRAIDDVDVLSGYWKDKVEPFLTVMIKVILNGVKVKPLFLFRSKLIEVCGEELANDLYSGGSGILDSMKPLLLLEDVIDGKIDEDQYMEICGHRHVNEMELMKPYPYEIPDYISSRIEEHKKAGISVHKMKEECEKNYEDAKKRFKELYPGKAKWLEKKLAQYGDANRKREEVRSKGVRIYCVLREFFLKAGELLGIGDDVFMLYNSEVLAALKGDTSSFVHIPARKESMKLYESYPKFPNVIRGRFIPEEWLAGDEVRNDYYGELPEGKRLDHDVKGFPGSAGICTGTVRVITDLSEAEQLEKGEILVTSATNIGWTIVFPRASAIVTDIGAPLSHAAIVAREFGIPAVVGCGNATTVLKTGDRVTIDGTHGTVKIIGKDQ